MKSMKQQNGVSLIDFLLALSVLLVVSGVTYNKGAIERSEAASKATWDTLETRATTADQKQFVAWTRAKCNTLREARLHPKEQQHLDAKCLNKLAESAYADNWITIHGLRELGLDPKTTH
jgi:hypothetical protein